MELWLWQKNLYLQQDSQSADQARGYKTFFHAQSCYIIGILTFMSMKNSIYAYLSLKKAEFLDDFMLLSIINFMLSWVEHEIFFITSGPV